MNKHILLVMRWLKDKDSVSQEDLRESGRAASAAASAAVWAAAWDATNTGYWVNRYFEETGEDRAQYEKELEK